MAATKKHLGPADLGLDLGDGTDAPAFRWLIACQLFGARISQDIAARAYRELDQLGVLTPAKLADADWQTLVDALGRGGYRRYDESSAAALINARPSRTFRAQISCVDQRGEARPMTVARARTGRAAGGLRRLVR